MTRRGLFGGAIEVQLPERLVDVSNFRPVPDNQEVFADGNTDESVIVEVVVIDAIRVSSISLLTFVSVHSLEPAVLLHASKLSSCVILTIGCWYSKACR